MDCCFPWQSPPNDDYVLTRNNFAIDYNQFELIFYTQTNKRAAMKEDLDVKANCQNHCKFIISKCGCVLYARKMLKNCLEQCIYAALVVTMKSLLNKLLMPNGKRFHQREDLQNEVAFIDVETGTYSTRQRKKSSWG